MDITVVGAGALGLSAASALAEDGHTVTVLERDHPGAGNTSRAAGIVSTLTWNDDDYALIRETKAALGALSQWAREEGHAVPWRPLPSLAVATDVSWLDAMQERLERHGEEPRRLDAATAAAEFPDVHFAPGEEVLVAEDDGVVEAGDLAALLAARLAADGVTIERRRAALPDLDGPVVLAGGAWTAALAATAGTRLPLLNFRTQLASLAMPGIDVILHDAVHHAYVRPEGGGSVLAGDGTRLVPHDPDDFDAAADAAFRDHIAQAVVARLTHGAQARWRAGWAGLCVGTPDRRPLCGPVPGRDLYVLTGDNGFGLMRCLALGRRLADAVAGDTHPDTDPRRFGADPPTRFALREGYAPD